MYYLKDKDSVVHFRLPRELADYLFDSARLHNITVSEYVRCLLVADKTKKERGTDYVDSKTD